ncbi:MAG: hypothetical protein QOE70_5287 [Chthoniobacter sp.]|nr:hypothetical protein [Chthoniobacter sp.]
MEVAILSDIHSNLHALRAVLAECERRKIPRFCCLGDIVGYGAHPAECLKLVRSLKCPTVIGNHDFYAACGKWGDDLSDLAQAGVEYSIRKLTRAARQWLGDLPEVFTADTFTLVHASLHDPLSWEYIVSSEQARPSLLLQETPLCFYGHTHRPKLFVGGGSPPEMLAEGKFQFRRDGRYLINPGSVGQPRGEGDPRAQFVIFNPAELAVQFVKVEYDVQGAASAILAAGLPPYLADRLLAGV